MNLIHALDSVRRSRWERQTTADLTLARAQEVVDFLANDRRGAPRALPALLEHLRGKGNGPATINRKLSALNVVLEEAVRMGYLREKPALPWQREPRGRTRWLTPEEVEELAREVRNPLVAALVRFLSWTGLRVSEALALSWSDVTANAVRVFTLKGGNDRNVPLTVAAYDVLMAIPREGLGPFSNLSASVVNHEFRAARERLDWARGDREIVPHALRHTCASRLTQQGVPLPVVQAWLGHRSYRSTLRYTHVGDAALSEAARKLEGLS